MNCFTAGATGHAGSRRPVPQTGPHSAALCIAVAAVFTLLLVQQTQAQQSFGAKGGVSTSSYTGSLLDRTGWTRGFTGGVFVTVPMVDELSFQAEAMYVRKGAAISLTHGGARYTGTQRLHYVEVPVLLRVDWPPSRPASLHLVGGPAVAVRLGCSFTDASSDERGCDAGGRPLATHAIDVGLLAGGGLELDIGSARIVTEARLSFGLMTIDAAEDFERTNESVTLVAGIAVPVGSRTSRVSVR